jgi:hypothetical protein
MEHSAKCAERGWCAAEAEADAETLRLNVPLLHVEYPPIPLEVWRVIEAHRAAVREVPELRA